ncbi:MAG: response regulator [Magnetovibrio sp.]|nr:response regulator [Magnetovibrio sp.]
MYLNGKEPVAARWQRDDEPISHASAAARGLDISRVGALVLEKTQLMRETMSSVLRNLGMRDVRAAGSVDYAFELLVDRPADIIFTDWGPSLDGIEFLQILRRDPRSPNPYVPVVMVTANTEPRHVRCARDSGMTEYLAKPYSAVTVYKHIRAIAESKRPFVKMASFFGPDRRRRAMDFCGAERRLA